MARPPKFDYNSNDFYDEILALSMQGLTDAEIADSLEDKFDASLSPEVFCSMKNGNYDCWSDKENEERGARLTKALSRGRRKINGIVRGAYLKAALGGKKVKSGSKTSRKIKLSDGTLTDDEDVQTVDSFQEMPPNIQALSTWLYNHDQEWKKACNSKGDEETETEGSINVEKWIEAQ